MNVLLYKGTSTARLVKLYAIRTIGLLAFGVYKSSIFALTIPILDPFCTLQSSAAAVEGKPEAGVLPESSGQQEKSSSAQKPRLADIFRTENLRARAVLLIIIW
jgi:hypothetical protein